MIIRIYGNLKLKSLGPTRNFGQHIWKEEGNISSWRNQSNEDVSVLGADSALTKSWTL